MVHTFSPEQQQVIDRVRNEGHQYVLRWLGELSETERDFFLRQLADLDFERVRELADLIRQPQQELSVEDIEPAPVKPLPTTEPEFESEARVAGSGARALRKDRVAALTVAGGHGTRLGYNAPKGTYPITPILKKSLLQVLAEKVLAARRRYGCRMPWLIMTSRNNDAAMREFLAEGDFFNLGADTVHLFTQRDNPILGADGQILMEEKGRLLMGPDGHGGVFEALRGSGLLTLLEDGGFDLISYFQVDNPLVTVADERFLGHHLQAHAEFSCKVIPKRDAAERLGVAVLRSGRPAIVEYSDMPRAIAEECLPSGELKHLHGSIAVHIINTESAREMAEGAVSLPWHLARKQYEVVGDDGQKAESDPKGCCKFERFVFDCMGHAAGCAFVEADRASEFAPVKNAEGPDSPAAARAAMRTMWTGWLKEAGVDTSGLEDPAAQLEIAPLFATNAQELKAKLPPQWRPIPPVVLDG